VRRIFSGVRIGDEGDRSDMAEYGEWNRKGAVLSDVTAQKEYGVTRDFIVKGVQAGELEFREGAVWGNPYLRVLIRISGNVWTGVCLLSRATVR
jgi:hypothetical protein